MAYYHRRRKSYEEPEHVRRGRERAQRSNEQYDLAFGKLTRGLVRVTSEELASSYQYRMPEWVRTRKGERTIATALTQDGSEPIGYLKRVPGIGIVAHSGIGTTYYLLPRVAKRIELEVKAIGGRQPEFKSMAGKNLSLRNALKR